jgi:pimeloyl-ACP methyl ester carboxylesterase
MSVARRSTEDMGYYRFVSQAAYAAARQHWDMTQLEVEASWPLTTRRQAGHERLNDLLEYALERVPAYADVDRGLVAERGLAALPLLGKSDLRSSAEHMATGATPRRWNRTSGSTNVPLRTPLGSDHERNQIVRWLRHWRHFGVQEPSALLFLVPRAYRLRVFGGGQLRDLAGGHTVYQRHLGSSGDLPFDPDLVIANPHVLGQLYANGWALCPKVLVTSYEQRPTGLDGWWANRYGDVYGLSEVGDVAWQCVGDPVWQLHEDMVFCEVLAVGQSGATVVGELAVTDLTNRILPILRYRTGDIVEALVHDGRVGEFRSVLGRRIQVAHTPLAGVDVMSVLLPALLDTGERARVGATATRVVVYAEVGSEARARLRARLARILPSVTVTDDPRELAGLTDVLQTPTSAELVQIPPPLTKAVAGRDSVPNSGSTSDCRCRQRPLAAPAGGAATCDSGQGPRTLLCLPPGPGIGHQVLRSLHEIFVGLAKVRIIEYPLHGYERAEVADRESLLHILAGLLTGRQVVLGHSFGADLAVDLAARSSGAQGLVLLSPPAQVPSTPGWSPHNSAVASRLRTQLHTGDWYRRYLTDYALPLGFGGDISRSTDLLRGVPTFEQAWRKLRRTAAAGSLRERVAAVGIPTLILSGRDDPLVSRTEIAGLSTLPNTTTVELQGSHFPFVDAPEDVRRAVSRFLHTLSASDEIREPT